MSCLDSIFQEINFADGSILHYEEDNKRWLALILMKAGPHEGQSYFAYRADVLTNLDSHEILYREAYDRGESYGIMRLKCPVEFLRSNIYRTLLTKAQGKDLPVTHFSQDGDAIVEIEFYGKEYGATFKDSTDAYLFESPSHSGLADAERVRYLQNAMQEKVQNAEKRKAGWIENVIQRHREAYLEDLEKACSLDIMQLWLEDVSVVFSQYRGAQTLKSTEDMYLSPNAKMTPKEAFELFIARPHYKGILQIARNLDIALIVEQGNTFSSSSLRVAFFSKPGKPFSESTHANLLLESSQIEAVSVPTTGERDSGGAIYLGMTSAEGNALLTSPADEEGTYSPDEAEARALNLSMLGLKGWRIPTVSQLKAVFNVVAPDSTNTQHVYIAKDNANTGQLVLFSPQDETTENVVATSAKICRVHYVCEKKI